MNESVSVFERSIIESEYTPPTRECIILPKELYFITKEMVNVRNETRGVLLCQRQTGDYDIFIVRSMIKIGEGNAFSVFPDENKLRAINKLIQDNPDIKPIDFHAHTIHTGEAYYNTFSGGDFRSIGNNVERNPNYRHVLFTPTHILTFGKNRPVFELSNNNMRADVWRGFYKWRNIFNKNVQNNN